MKPYILLGIALAAAVVLVAVFSPPTQTATVPSVMPIPHVVYVNLTEAASVFSSASVFGRTPSATPFVSVTQAQAASAVGGYSQTNVQVEGIDEGDFVKTDGRWIYICTGGVLYLVSPDLKIAGSYAVGGPCQLLVYGGNVLAIWQEGGYTRLSLLSAGLRQISSFSVEGTPLGARLEGGYAYVVVSAPLTPHYYVNGSLFDVLPMFAASKPAGEVAVVAVDMSSGRINYSAFAAGEIYRIYMYGHKLYLFQGPDELGVLASAVEARKGLLPPGVRDELERYIAEGDYVGLYKALRSLDAPALEALSGFSAQANTTIYALEVDGLSIRLAGVGQIPGVLTDQFAVAQLGGYLVAAATEAVAKVLMVPVFCPMIVMPNSAIYVNGREWGVVEGGRPTCPPPILTVEVVPTGGASLYVLGPSLEPVANVSGLAPGEAVRAGRLVGRVYYVVTYRAVDPLFAVDLSDPARPRVLGYLKAPGFTGYLHPVAPGLLLGVGSNGRGGLQILLYNVSDPASPYIASNVTVTNAYSPALGDYHAFLYRDGLAFLPVYGAKPFLLVLSVAGGRLDVRAVVIADAPILRVLYIGDVYYLVEPGKIAAYNSSFVKTGELSLNS
ncbi:MAG: beta-propeller domain-containing protein [Thermoproteus sp.]